MKGYSSVVVWAVKTKLYTLGKLVFVCVKEHGETRTDHGRLITAHFYIFLLDCHLNCPSKKEIII